VDIRGVRRDYDFDVGPCGWRTYSITLSAPYQYRLARDSTARPSLVSACFQRRPKRFNSSSRRMYFQRRGNRIVWARRLPAGSGLSGAPSRVVFLHQGIAYSSPLRTVRGTAGWRRLRVVVNC
jgi:hypothetical protein